MGNIVLLDDLTINKIAAGEVIERPASVVKELIENSIDAGSTSVTAEIKNGGITYIRITDNGKGILPDDMEIAFERHATSKIRTAKDLEKVKSMGFRGEALASIAAIARVELTSKTEGSELGYKIVVEGGKVLSKEVVGCPKGTTIIVENLFFNTPVRYKFLKKDFTELGYIEDTITRLALVNPDIAIKLINSGKNIIQTTGNSSVKDVVYSIYGKETAENIINIDYKLDDMRIYGCIGNSTIAKSNRSYQLFFVNKRYVKDKTLSSAADQAFKNTLPAGKFGFLALNIEIDSSKIDVNVHPAKLEIRFQEESQVFKLVYHAIKDALGNKEEIISEPKETDIEKISLFEDLKNTIKQFNSTEKTDDESLSTDAVEPNEGLAEFSGTGNLVEDLYNYKVKTHQIDEYDPNDFPDEIIENLNEDKKEEIANKENDLEDLGGEIIKIDEMDGIIKSLESENNPSQDSDKQTDNKEWNNISSNENDSDEIVENKSFEEMYEKTFGIAKNKNVEITNEVKPEENSVKSISLNKTEPVASFKNVNLYSKIKYKFVGIVFSTYIAVEIEDELYLINQKLANESIIYENLTREYYNNKKTQSQQMLLPDIVNLSQKEMDIVKDNINILTKAGFDIEEFGENTIKLSGVPDVCIDLDTKDLIIECINKINTIARTAKKEIEEKLFETIASKIAEKTKLALTFEEVDALMQKLLLQKNTFFESNKKGIAIRFSKSEIDEKF